jgi:hypothetical protein
MKAPMNRDIVIFAVYAALVLVGCSKSPTGPGSGDNGKTSNGYFTITEPSFGDTAMQGDRVPVEWTSSASVTDSFVTVSLYKGSNLVITAVQRNTGIDTVQIPYSGSGTNYRIRISSASDTSQYDMSSNFKVSSGYSGTLWVTSPIYDSSWTRGTYHYILWSSSGSVGPVNIQLYNDTTVVSTIASANSNSGSYYGQIPAGVASGNRYRIKISSVYDVSICAYSDFFPITSGYFGTYTVTSPTIDSIWNRGAYHYIQWTSTGSPGAVNIYLYNNTTFVSTIASLASNSGSYNYLFPSTLVTGNRYRIKITSYYDTSLYSYSSNFSIISGYFGTYTVTSPTIDSIWNRNATHSIQWSSTGLPGAVTLDIYRGTTYVSTIVSGATNNGSYSYFFPLTLASGNTYRIKITSYNDTSLYTYSGNFTIVSGYSGTVTVTSPTVDSLWNRGAYHYVRWDTTGSPGAYVNIYLYNGTTNVSPIASMASNSGSYYYLFPANLASGTQYRVVVSSYYDASISDTSDYFAITSGYSGTYTITSPTGDSVWSAGTYHYIDWTYTGTPGNYTTICLYNNTSLVSTLTTTATTSNGHYNGYLSSSLAGGSTYRIRVLSSADSSVSAYSSYFTIQASPISPVVGIWNVTYNWGGTPGSSLFTLDASGTFSTDQANSGTWTFVGNTLTMTFSNGCVYTGTVSGQAASGTMTNGGSSGTWSAVKQ